MNCLILGILKEFSDFLILFGFIFYFSLIQIIKKNLNFVLTWQLMQLSMLMCHHVAMYAHVAWHTRMFVCVRVITGLSSMHASRGTHAYIH